jgi:hypothetical protein
MAGIALDDVRLASPCEASWESMKGSDRARFCETCHLYVYNIASMTKAEAENLLDASEQRVCVRLYRRTDGTILTRDCPVGQRDRRLRLAGISIRVGLLFSLVAAAAAVPWFLGKRQILSAGFHIGRATSDPAELRKAVERIRTETALSPRK